MKIDQKIGKYLNITEFNIHDFEKKTFFKWLRKKENVYDLSRKNSLVATVFHQDMTNLIPSDFYVIFEKDTFTADILLYEFNPKATQKLFFRVMEKVFKGYENLQNEPDQSYRKVYMYIPFQIGNIFSKSRYLHEANIFHMDTLLSYKSVNKNRKTALNDWCTEKSIALYHEFKENTAMEYDNRFAYIDYLKIYLNILPGFNSKWIMINFEDIEQFDNKMFVLPTTLLTATENHMNAMELILNAMDYKFFEEICMQQRALLFLMETELDKDKSNQHMSANEVLLKLEKKVMSSEDTVKEIFQKFQNEDWFDKKYKNEYKKLIKLVFGEHSIYFDTDDKRKVFFSGIKESFEEYYNAGFRSKDIKYFFNQDWIPLVKEIEEKIKKDLFGIT